MPLLRYICEDCKNVFEELTTADKKPPCPRCASQNTVRYYQGKCNFGSKGGGGCSGSNCSSCKGCGS